MSNKILLAIDIQKEYITEGRPFRIPTIVSSLLNAKAVLDYARSQHWLIYHIQHCQEEGTIFHPDQPFSEFVSGFEPLPGETCYQKNDYSCYSNPSLAQTLLQHRSSQVFVIGYGTTMCVLSTLIDGHHRGQKCVLVEDATAAKSTDRFTGPQLLDACLDILKPFCTMQKTQDLLNAAIHESE